MESARKRKISTDSSPDGMVSTASSVATNAGVQMLEKGGNAVDAAVAAAFCLGVTEPQASGLGGQSMVLLRLSSGEVVALDGSSRAPFGLKMGSFPAEPLKLGVKAATVPSTPAVLGYLLERYGTLPLWEVLEPSIVAARSGFTFSALQHKLLTREMKHMDESAKEILLKDNRPLRAGEAVVQPQLAHCLEKMATAGWRDFYQGEIAATIAKDMEVRGGFISAVDLSKIPFPVERPVLQTTYRGYGITTFPPPGAGRALSQILNTLENFAPEELSFASANSVVIMALAFHAALRDRENALVDPALYPQEMNKWMLDKNYAQVVAQRIKRLTALKVKPSYMPPSSSGETTHLSVADGYGNLVGITQSVELVFGAKCMAKNLGFFYNNYMSAFDYKDMMHPFYLLPGTNPWSSVAPTLVFKGNMPILLLGSPGSERISTSLVQVLTRFLDGGLDLADAIAAPRLHAGSTGRVDIEQDRFPTAAMAALAEAGIEVKHRSAYSFYLGCVQAVAVGGSGMFYGAADPRRDGTAKGPKMRREEIL